MATLSSTNPTLADVAARMTPDGKIDPAIVEMLNETNEILDDMTAIEANGFTEHKTTVPFRPADRHLAQAELWRAA